MEYNVNLCDAEHCTQCFACATICPKGCISMAETQEGVRYPVIDRSRCIACGLCMKVCHQLSFRLPGDVSSVVYASWAIKQETRTKSSSGGVFSVLAEHVLRKGGVVYGAAYGDFLKVKHIRIEQESNLQQLRGSKYVQSDLSGVYKSVREDLQKGIDVLFSGTPCQIAGLRTFLRQEYENLYCIDLICHGVPPQKLFDSYLQHIGIKAGRDDCFDFRYCKGWGFELALNRRRIPVADGYYLKAFTFGYMFLEACYACKYACKNRVGDVTLGDFWGLGVKTPFPYSTSQGVSLVLANTSKGKGLLAENKEYLFLCERTFEEAAAYNHNLVAASSRPLERDSYPLDSMAMDRKDLIKKYALQVGWKEYLRPLKKRIVTLLRK